MHAAWPDIPYEPWRETCAALHLFAQIVGKYRFARTPWVNHSWHATFYVTARGLTTSLVPDGLGGIEITLDLIDHAVVAAGADGTRVGFSLSPMSVATFHDRFRNLVRSVGGNPEFDGRPNEVPEPIPFADDRLERPYDAEAVTRFFQAVVRIDRVLKLFRSSFIGKVSPVHLFWGSFDLAVTRFSGRTAPLHPGGMPGLPDDVTREAYSHEVSSAGFWPGAGINFPAFYSYAYPTPPALLMRAPIPREHTTTTHSGSSCCPTTSSGCRRLRNPRSWPFLRVRTVPPRIWVGGIERRWNARWESLADPDPSNKEIQAARLRSDHN